MPAFFLVIHPPERRCRLAQPSGAASRVLHRLLGAPGPSPKSFATAGGSS